MEPVTSPHSRYHYSNGLDEEKDITDNQTKKTNINTNTKINTKQEIPKQVIAKETSKKESK